LKIGIVVAVLLAVAVFAGLGAYYYWVGQQLDDIRDRLVTEGQLEHPDEPNTMSGIRLAPIQCARVYDLRANPIARRLRTSPRGSTRWRRSFRGSAQEAES
jgi:hypothetical protein